MPATNSLPTDAISLLHNIITQIQEAYAPAYPPSCCGVDGLNPRQWSFISGNLHQSKSNLAILKAYQAKPIATVF